MNKPSKKWKAGFKIDGIAREEDGYKPEFWFTYTCTTTGDTVHSCFPPIGQPDTYAGLTPTEMRTLTFARLNELKKRYGTVAVTPYVEGVAPC
jgi:hypothetical protein